MRNKIKPSKRIGAILLALCIIASLFACLPITASAASETLETGGASFNKMLAAGVPVKTGVQHTNNDVFGDLVSLVRENPKAYVGKYNESSGVMERTAFTGWWQPAPLWDNDIEDGDETNINTVMFATGEEICSSCNTPYPSGSMENTCPACAQKGTTYHRRVGKYLTDGTKVYVDIEHDLKEVKKIENIVISNNQTKLLQTSAYRIYASNDLSTLYSDQSIIFERTNANVPQRDQIVGFNSDFSARYVALRIYNPLGSGDETELKNGGACSLYRNAYIRLYEFNVLAKQSYAVIGTAIGVADYNKKITSKISLIEGKNPVSAFCYSEGTKHTLYERIYEVDQNGNVVNDEYGKNIEITNQNPNYSILTNDDVKHDDEIRATNEKLYFVDDSGKLINDETKMYAEFHYKLEAEAKILGAEVYGHTSAHLSPSHIKVSVADNEADLFTDKANYTTGSIERIGNSIGTDLKVAVTGTYVGIRIISGCNEDALQKNIVKRSSYLRIREISVYGEYTQPAALPKIYNSIYHSSGVKNELNYRDINVSVNLDTAGKAPAGCKTTITTPASVRYEGKIYSFAGWFDSKSNLLCDALDYNNYLLKTTSEELYAQYKEGSTKTVTYKFADRNGNIIYSTKVPFGHYLSREQYGAANAAIPALPGYEVKKELIEFGSRTAIMPVWNEDIYNYPAASEVTFTPVYVAEATLYNVEYDTQTTQHRFDAKVTFKKDSAASWTVNGIVWASGSVFSAHVPGNMKVVAQSSSTSQAISLFNNAYIKNGDIAVFAKFVNLSSNSIAECGIVFASGDYLNDADYKNGTYSKFEVGDQGVQTVKAEKYSTSGGFSVNLQNVGRKRTRVARAYVIYAGSTTPVYSNIIVAKTN